MRLFLLTFLIGFFSNAEQIEIAVEDEAAPWSYSDGTGYANDLVKKAYNAVGVDVIFKVYSYARCKLAAENGDVVACFTASKTKETEAVFDFPKYPLIDVQFVLWVAPKTTKYSCDTSKWPKPLHVVAVGGYEYVQKFEDLKQKEIIKVQYANSEGQALAMMLNNRAEAAIINVDEVKNINYVLAGAKLKQQAQRMCDLGTMPGYLAFSKKHKAAQLALNNFNKGYEALVKNGQLAELKKSWSKMALSKLK